MKIIDYKYFTDINELRNQASIYQLADSINRYT